MPLKNLRNFWRSLEMLLINCKTELKLKWVKHVLAAGGNDNTIQKLSKLLSKGIERSVYWKSYKTKS